MLISGNALTGIIMNVAPSQYELILARRFFNVYFDAQIRLNKMKMPHASPWNY